MFDRFIQFRAEDQVEKLKEKKNNEIQEYVAKVRRKSSLSVTKPVIDENRISTKTKVPESIGIPAVSNLALRVQSLTNHFVLLASFYVEKSIFKAISLDTFDSDMMTSSMVDDIFYIVKSTLQRGVSTGDAGCLCGLVNSISRILEDDYMSLLLNRLSAAFNSVSSVASGVTITDERLGAVAPTLNNIDVSCSFINRLCSEIEKDVNEKLKHCSVLEREQISSCLSSLTDYSEKTRNILKTWIENYYGRIIKPKIRFTRPCKGLTCS